MIIKLLILQDMCGISGIISKKRNELAISSEIQMMNKKLKHRGPDDEGFYLIFDNYSGISASSDETVLFPENELTYKPTIRIEDKNINCIAALGHRRLSIIDLSHLGHLPMCDSERKLWLTYNGEIFNYREIREELKASGYNFISNSDSEVIIYAYKEWGFKCVDHFDGMWAFVLWDAEKKIFFGSRDRTGVKPLYYYNGPDYLSFASEIKALISISGFEKKINRKALEDYIYNAEIEVDGSTLFEDVFELLPGHNFFFDISRSEFWIDKYFNPKDLKEDRSSISNNEFIDLISNAVVDSVEKRLNAEVPVGFCLSGGIDSSSIVGVANQINKKRNLEQVGSSLSTFTAVNGFSQFDESKWASRLAEDLNLKWIQAECNSDDLKIRLSQMIYYQDSPLCSTSTYAQNQVLKIASENGMKIMLDGQGGDELFGGYPSFYFSYLYQLLKEFKFTTLFTELNNQQNSPVTYSFYLKQFAKYLFHQNPSLYSRLFKPELSLLNAEFQDGVAGISTTEDLSGNLNEALFDYTYGFYLKNLLRWEDRCAMQFSVESRTPFADNLSLLQLSHNLPDCLKIQKGWSKFALRESMRAFVPDYILERRDKLGFSTPQAVWIKEMEMFLKDIIFNTKSIIPILNLELLEKRWDAIFKEDKFYREQQLVWRYANYLIWQEEFFNA